LLQVRVKANILEAAFSKGSCIKYRAEWKSSECRRWLQRSRGTRQRETSRKRRLPQKESAQSHICQNPYAPPLASRAHQSRRRKESLAARAEKFAPLMTCEIRIGTSGYHYKHWRGPFYPKNISPNQMLEFYSQNFDTVEL